MNFNTRSPYSVRLLCAILLVLASPLLLKSQENPKPLINSTLAGTVLDAKTKEPLVGVSIQLKGTTHSAQTDGKGRFQFVTGQKFPYNILISYIGYEKREVTATGSPIEVLLKEDIKALNEVVVVGYGTQSRRSVIGSVSTIKTSEIANQPSASFDQQIQGRAAGVQVGSNTGVPGDGLFFRIRGTTSINASSDPLYIIDGVFINNQSLQKITTQGQSNNPLADINPSDIESISILKDAEATPMRDINRTFELTGVAGGRRVFYYQADTNNKTLYLQDKNVPRRREGQEGPAKASKPKQADNWIPEEARVNIGDENLKIDPLALTSRRTRGIQAEKERDPKRNRMILRYSTTDGSQVILEGTDEHKNSVYMVLNRIDRKYTLSEGKLGAGKY